MLRSATWWETGTLGLLVGFATFSWRSCANMPQLNSDGVPSFSANDLLAPVITYVVLGIYACLSPPTDTNGFSRARAVLSGIALIVNVVTI
jgi:hypothetical protein